MKKNTTKSNDVLKLGLKPKICINSRSDHYTNIKVVSQLYLVNLVCKIRTNKSMKILNFFPGIIKGKSSIKDFFVKFIVVKFSIVGNYKCYITRSLVIAIGEDIIKQVS